MLTLRGCHRKKALPKKLGGVQPVLQTTDMPITSPIHTLDLAMACNSSLKTTLANSMKDNEVLHKKIQSLKVDLKSAREYILEVADYNEWRTKAQLGYEAGCKDGAKRVFLYIRYYTNTINALV